MNLPIKRLAFVVSHPIQYYAPLYQRLAQRGDLSIKVFYTWHAGGAAVRDSGFLRPVAWDIPLTDGYAFEGVPNTSRDPGTHHFFGIRNPSLVKQICAWQPDAVHVSGWAWHSHLQALRRFHSLGIPTLFRGDSHLLDGAGSGPRAWLKRAVLRQVYSWPRRFLYVGTANRAYYEYFGVPAEKLHYSPHAIDVSRFSDPDGKHEREAVAWRRELSIRDEQVVVLFAGKFEKKKQPLEFVRAVQSMNNPDIVAVMIGNGELEDAIKEATARTPGLFRLLPFQNQSRMPTVYRVGDLFVLPSAFNETWGLAVNEALASGRPVLVSDHVGCAADLVATSCGGIFRTSSPVELTKYLAEMTARRATLLAMRAAARNKGPSFDIAAAETTLMACLEDMSAR